MAISSEQANIGRDHFVVYNSARNHLYSMCGSLCYQLQIGNAYPDCYTRLTTACHAFVDPIALARSSHGVFLGLRISDGQAKISDAVIKRYKQL